MSLLNNNGPINRQIQDHLLYAKASLGGVLRNFTKFTGNHLCQSVLFNKVAGLSVYIFC